MLTNPTTGAALEEAACAHFLPYLTSAEDFDSFETSVAGGMRSFAAKCVARSIEAFDASLHGHVPRGWALHEVAERTIVTIVGEVTYRRSVYLDRCGRRRTWADELLGIPKRARLSACAFLWVMRHAAELSYRKAADEFERETGCRISHVTVMNCVREEGRRLSEMTSRIAASMPSGKRRDKAERLASYAAANAADIRFPEASLGTMEGTNFRVGAVRCKNNATS